jgi:hypothetical protein
MERVMRLAFLLALAVNFGSLEVEAGELPEGSSGCVISDGQNEVALEPGTEVSSVRQYLGDLGVWVTSYGGASASIYKWTSYSGFITDVNGGESWDNGTFNSVECEGDGDGERDTVGEIQSMPFHCDIDKRLCL